jgi:hypothetical protein
MTTLNAAQLAEAAARVSTWPTLPADHRAEVEVATIDPRHGAAVLSYRGRDESYTDVFAAQRAASAMGVPAEWVRVRPFPPLSPCPPEVLAESPVLRVL